MSERTTNNQVGTWVASVSLIALGLFAVSFPAGAYGQHSFYGMLALPVGVTVFMSLLIDRWRPVLGRQAR